MHRQTDTHRRTDTHRYTGMHTDPHKDTHTDTCEHAHTVDTITGGQRLALAAFPTQLSCLYQSECSIPLVLSLCPGSLPHKGNVGSGSIRENRHCVHCLLVATHRAGMMTVASYCWDIGGGRKGDWYGIRQLSPLGSEKSNPGNSGLPNGSPVRKKPPSLS